MRLLLRPNGHADARSNGFLSMIAAVVPVPSRCSAIVVGILPFPRSRFPIPPAELSLHRSSLDTEILAPADTTPIATAQVELFARLFLYRWENGRSPPSTIKQITGFAYGFRCADPPFFRLIAAPALPFNSHQELA